MSESPAPDRSGAPAARDEAAASAGRGVAFIGLAKIYFMIAGAAIEIGLKNLAGKYVFGAYGYVSSMVSTVNNVVVTGTIQAVSRETTANPGAADVAKATGFKLHTRLGLPVALVFAAAAPLWARYVARDADIAGPLMLASAIIAGYSFYAVLVGSANGTRAFHKQAGLDVSFATLRAAGILGGGVLGLGVYGAIGGWVAAVVAIFALAASWIGLPRAKAGPIAPMFRFLGGVAAYLVVTNLFLAADTLMLKPLATTHFMELGLAADAAANESNGVLGLYRAVQTLARLPYQLMVAVTFVVFPLVSQATFDNDRERARSYVRTTMRYSLVFAGAMGAALAAHAGPLLDVPYNLEVATEGGPALSALALGHVAFALFTIGGTILNSAGRTRQAVAGAATTVLVLLAALYLVIPRLDAGREMLLGAALCTSGAMLLGALVTGAQLWRAFGVFVPVMTGVRVVAAVAAAFAICRVLPREGALFGLVGAVLAGLTYLMMLVVTGELGRADLERVLAVARRRK